MRQDRHRSRRARSASALLALTASLLAASLLAVLTACTSSGPAASPQPPSSRGSSAAGLVATISASLPIDEHRIYVTGISNEGMLAYRLACDTTLFAAIGPDSATLLGSCPSPEPTSVIHIHGTADQTIPYSGGPGRHDNGGSGDRPADTAGPPIPDLIDTWRKTDTCAPAMLSSSGAVAISIATCPNGRAVELITLTGAGHQWRGQPRPSASLAATLDPPFPGLDATSTIWTFFNAHPKPD